MNKFTFRLANRVKICVIKDGEENQLCFCTDTISTFVLDEDSIKFILDSLLLKGLPLVLNPPKEVGATYDVYVLSLTMKTGEDNQLTLTKVSPKRSKALYKTCLTRKDTKKFIKVCHEIWGV